MSSSTIVLITASLTLLFAPITYHALLRLGLFDVPNSRSSHLAPTLRGGGVACLMAVLTVWAVCALMETELPNLAVASAVAISIVGLLDDLLTLSALPRLVSQMVVGSLLGVSTGHLTGMLVGAAAFPVLVNAVNFMDGINGISGLSVVAWGLAVLILDVPMGVTLLAGLAVGAALGFLPWNLARARMFLGDAGSYLFGGLVAAAVVIAPTSDGGSWLVLTPMAIYLWDTGFTMTRRALAGERVMSPHRDHIYQRITRDRGWSHTQVALVVAALSLATGGAWALLPDPLWAAVVTVVILLVYTLLPGRLPLPAPTEEPAVPQ